MSKDKISTKYRQNIDKISKKYRKNTENVYCLFHFTRTPPPAEVRCPPQIVTSMRFAPIGDVNIVILYNWNFGISKIAVPCYVTTQFFVVYKCRSAVPSLQPYLSIDT
jgi:hypothetical protein